ncbi:olfactory receptor 10G4-like [Haplochromis burtoni]|uniref:olfactory receptor 10G4-like n=1 Tax=Haplochromis burtoni TaxID=8153 RepID=UPI001C2D5DE4|nr:olfactory receptor 10G4-like [Haplochromis burtoni]
MLIIYLLAVIANVLNILFIIFDKRLHKPMYILICNLAVVDILYCCATLPYCTSRMKYAFCDYAAVIRTTCVDPNYYFNLVSVMMFFLLFFTFSFIGLSYFVIAFLMKFSSNRDKKKMASTCVSHLIVVTCYYSPLFVLIVFTRVGVVLTLEERQGLLIGTILSPSLVNPVVYCFRTKEIKNKIFKIFTKKADILN